MRNNPFQHLYIQTDGSTPIGGSGTSTKPVQLPYRTIPAPERTPCINKVSFMIAVTVFVVAFVIVVIIGIAVVIIITVGIAIAVAIVVPAAIA